MSPVSIPEGIMERGGASSKLIFCFIIFIRDGNFERNWGGKRIFIARFLVIGCTRYVATGKIDVFDLIQVWASCMEGGGR